MSTKLVKVPLAAYEKAVKLSQEKGVTIGAALEYFVNMGEVQPNQADSVNQNVNTYPSSVMVSIEDSKQVQTLPRVNNNLNAGDIMGLLEKAYSKGQDDILSEQRMELLEEAAAVSKEMVISNTKKMDKIETILGGLGLGLADHLEQHTRVIQGDVNAMQPQSTIDVITEAFRRVKGHGDMEKALENFKTQTQIGELEDTEAPELQDAIETQTPPKRRGFLGL